MNFTLFSLSLYNFSLASPIFSPSFHSFSSFKTLTYSNLHIAHSTQSFLFMKSYLPSSLYKQQASILFSNSHFTNFLHSTISISDRSDKNSDNIRKFNRERIENTIYSSEDLVLKAVNCFFVDCTEPISGGAIDMICEESSLYVIKCCFVNCFAQNHGGAISFFGNLFKVNDTCYDGCYTMDSGMAMELYVRGSREKMTMNRLSITYCADPTVFNAKHEEPRNNNNNKMHDFERAGQFGVYLSNVIDMNRGKQKLKAINSTNNIVHLTGGFCISDESISFSLSYSTIMNSIADSLFNIYDINSNNGNMSYCNILNNTGSLSLTIFDLENSSLIVSYCTFLENNLTFVASNGNLHFENCAYDFNSKAPPLENAEFTETGSMLHKLKKWISAKTIAFEQEQIDNNAKIYSRCRKNKPRDDRRQQFHNDDFNRFRNFENDNDEIIRNNDDKDDNNDDEDKKKKNDEYDDRKNQNKDDNDNDKKNNKNDDDDENFNIFNNKNNNNRNDNKNEEEDDDDDKKNKKNRFINNQIQIADNEEEDEPEGNENKNHNDKVTNEKSSNSFSGLLIVVFIVLFGGVIAFVYFYFIKDRERDINDLQDVELL